MNSRLLVWLAEAAGGLVVGGVAAPLVGYGIGILLTALGAAQTLEMGLLVVMLYAGLIGFVVGASAGVALVGRWLRWRGSFWRALIAGLVGVVAVVLLIRYAGLLGSGGAIRFALALIVLLILTVAGYQRARPPAVSSAKP